MAAIIGNREISLGVMGGTLITAACYGGGEVFGCSPYDAATTAYLKATYPLYWAQIRDYGFANPQLVPWINEDNDLIVSLVGVGKVRWVVKTQNNNDHFDTGLIGGLDRYYVKAQLEIPNDSNYYLLGNFNQNGQSGLFKDGQRVLYIYYKVGQSSNTKYDLAGVNTPFLFETSNEGIFADGVKKADFPTDAQHKDGPLFLFGTGVGASFSGRGKCGLLRLWNDQVDKTFIPFKRNGQMELLDIVTGTLATRVGTFTELIENTPT